MRVKLEVAAGSLAVLLLAACAPMAAEMPAPIKTGNSSLGPVLTDAKGMTLYYFDKDVAGKSNCNDKCAENWPPLMASGDAKAVQGFTVIARDDGSKQWAHNGMPLYLWVKDTKPGDTTGHRFRDVWTAAKP